MLAPSHLHEHIDFWALRYGWYYVSCCYVMILKDNSVLMIWYSIQSPKCLNPIVKFNHKHMACFLFNIIKERVCDHRFIFLEHALVAIIIRIISEPILVHLLLKNWLEVIKCPCRPLFYLDLIAVLKLRMWFFYALHKATQLYFTDGCKKNKMWVCC